MKLFGVSRISLVPVALLLLLPAQHIQAAARVRSSNRRPRQLSSGGSGKGKGGSGGSGGSFLSRSEYCSGGSKGKSGKGSGGSGKSGKGSGGSGKGSGGSGKAGKGSGGSNRRRLSSGGSGKGKGGSGGSGGGGGVTCNEYCDCMCYGEMPSGGSGKAGKGSGGSGKAGKGSGGSGKGSGGSGKAGKGSGGSGRRLNSGGSGKGSGGSGKGSGGSGKGGKGSGGSGGGGDLGDICGPCDCRGPPPEGVCIKSHAGFPDTVYDPLSGWSWDVTSDTIMNCDDSGIWDIGWEDDGKFDYLVLIRKGEQIMQWGESCPVNYPVQEGDRLVFYTDNSHEYAGFRICLEEGESREDDGSGASISSPAAVATPSQPKEGIVQGNCFVSHATWDGQNNDYEQFYGYTLPVEKDTTITAESFNIRDRFTAQSLKLWRNGEVVKKWQGTLGPDGEPVSQGDMISFFVDDSGIYAENTGFKVCFAD